MGGLGCRTRGGLRHQDTPPPMMRLRVTSFGDAIMFAPIRTLVQIACDDVMFIQDAHMIP